MSTKVDGSESVSVVEPSFNADISTASSRKRIFGFLEEKWNRIQIGHQGTSSVERLESFDYYCKTASWTRVVVVYVIAPIPALSTALLLECLPLQSPSEGWAANWVFWIRLTLTTAVMGCAGMSKLVTLVPDLDPTFFRRQLVACSASAAYVGTALIAAIIIGFPIPLMWYVGGFVVGIYAQVIMVLVFGREPFVNRSATLQRFIPYFAAIMTLCNIYPLYKILDGFVPKQFAAKQFMVRCTRGLEDFMAQIVAMTVDFFSALFVSACMSTTSSMYLSMLFIAADIGQSLLEFWDVRSNANTVKQLLLDRHESSLRFKGGVSITAIKNSRESTFNLVDWILAVTRDPFAVDITLLKNSLLSSSAVSRTTEQTLQVLEISGIFSAASNTSRHHPRLLPRSIRVANATILPKNSDQVTAFTTAPSLESIKDEHGVNHETSDRLRHTATSESLVRQGLRLLFHCEYLTLVEYVECVVPLVFMIYKSVLKQLPNAVYYPGGADKWETGAVTNILIFAALEVVSLLLLHFYLQRQFSFSPLYQLAFVDLYGATTTQW
ncbi:hypothetical protein GN244_ATG17031 [Phytophthora infestans]|uniref:Transmembrane protein n=1 Tax=Phytophthora infestans TaxID=4787 RepID=A0A833W5U6_PHYIN|nr:hypothetical protein GN244_ATG17031 [Phytophthora infestans]